MRNEVVMAIIKKENKYLLVSLNKHLDKFAGFFCPVGGHVENGETKEDAVKREVQEELGIVVYDLKFVISTPGDIPQKTLFWYLCKTNDTEIKIDKREIKEAGFYSKEDILSMKLWPSVQEVFKNHLFNV